MDQSDIDRMVEELDRMSRELDFVQKEITKEIARKITSIQGMIEAMPEGSLSQDNGNREIVLEKAVARMTIRDNGQTTYEGLF